MVLNHILERAYPVIIGNAAFESDGFGNGDLDMVDRLSVPQRLEQHVGKAQREQVLDGLLAQIVVDADHMLFGEGVADLGIDLARRGKVVADRLFHRDAAFCAGDSGRLQPLRDRTEHRRRGRKIDADRTPHPFAEQGREIVITRAGAGIDRTIIDAVEERRDPGLVDAVGGQMLRQRRAHLRLERGAVAGYADELGNPSNTETFVALKAYIDNWRWKGVPFYLRTGKRMPERKSEVLIQFKPVPHNIFARVGAGKLDANSMIINLQPEENIRVKVMAKQPGLDRDGVKLKEVTMDVSLSHSFAGERRRIAYERLLLDFIEGDQTLFVRRDEVEAQWQWIDSIRDAWAAVDMAPQNYTAGSWGPSSAIALIERDGASWHD